MASDISTSSGILEHRALHSVGMSGSAVLVIVGEPVSQQDKDAILKKVSDGFMSWDIDQAGCDINAELAHIAASAPAGIAGSNGEHIIRSDSASLQVEVLVNPRAETVAEALRVLLLLPTKHKHLIHAGYSFDHSGNWVLQDGAFTFADAATVVVQPDVAAALQDQSHASLTLHCLAEGAWKEASVAKSVLGRCLRVSVNPQPLMQEMSGIVQFAAFLSFFVKPSTGAEALESSNLVGNVRFGRPTLYSFAAGRGDCALMGVSGFSMLVDGGAPRRSCFWPFARHLDRLDVLVVSHIGENNTFGLTSFLEKKIADPSSHPAIGHVYYNGSASKSGGSGELVVDLASEASALSGHLHQLGCSVSGCHVAGTAAKEPAPISLYHKVGHGSMDMYVLNSSKDERSDPIKAPTASSKAESTSSLATLVVWRPANPGEKVTRVLFPGNVPQPEVLKGIEKLKHLDCLRYPDGTKSAAAPVHKAATAVKKEPPRSLKSAATYATVSSASGTPVEEVAAAHALPTAEPVSDATLLLQRSVTPSRSVTKSPSPSPPKSPSGLVSDDAGSGAEATEEERVAAVSDDAAGAVESTGLVDEDERQDAVDDAEEEGALSVAAWQDDDETKPEALPEPVCSIIEETTCNVLSTVGYDASPRDFMGTKNSAGSFTRCALEENAETLANYLPAIDAAARNPDANVDEFSRNEADSGQDDFHGTSHEESPNEQDDQYGCCKVRGEPCSDTEEATNGEDENELLEVLDSVAADDITGTYITEQEQAISCEGVDIVENVDCMSNISNSSSSVNDRPQDDLLDSTEYSAEQTVPSATGGSQEFTNCHGEDERAVETLGNDEVQWEVGSNRSGSPATVESEDAGIAEQSDEINTDVNAEDAGVVKQADEVDISVDEAGVAEQEDEISVDFNIEQDAGVAEQSDGIDTEEAGFAEQADANAEEAGFVEQDDINPEKPEFSEQADEVETVINPDDVGFVEQADGVNTGDNAEDAEVVEQGGEIDIDISNENFGVAKHTDEVNTDFNTQDAGDAVQADEVNAEDADQRPTEGTVEGTHSDLVGTGESAYLKGSEEEAEVTGEVENADNGHNNFYFHAQNEPTNAEEIMHGADKDEANNDAREDDDKANANAEVAVSNTCVGDLGTDDAGIIVHISDHEDTASEGASADSNAATPMACTPVDNIVSGSTWEDVGENPNEEETAQPELEQAVDEECQADCTANEEVGEDTSAKRDGLCRYADSSIVHSSHEEIEKAHFVAADSILVEPQGTHVDGLSMVQVHEPRVAAASPHGYCEHADVLEPTLPTRYDGTTVCAPCASGQSSVRLSYYDEDNDEASTLATSGSSARISDVISDAGGCEAEGSDMRAARSDGFGGSFDDVLIDSDIGSNTVSLGDEVSAADGDQLDEFDPLKNWGSPQHLPSPPSPTPFGAANDESSASVLGESSSGVENGGGSAQAHAAGTRSAKSQSPPKLNGNVANASGHKISQKAAAGKKPLGAKQLNGSGDATDNKGKEAVKEKGKVAAAKPSTTSATAKPRSSQMPLVRSGSVPADKKSGSASEQPKTAAAAHKPKSAPPASTSSRAPPKATGAAATHAQESSAPSLSGKAQALSTKVAASKASSRPSTAPAKASSRPSEAKCASDQLVKISAAKTSEPPRTEAAGPIKKARPALATASVATSKQSAATAKPTAAPVSKAAVATKHVPSPSGAAKSMLQPTAAPIVPCYVDLAYVPHQHGDARQGSVVDFFRHVYARYYVLSGLHIAAAADILDALLTAKEHWSHNGKSAAVTVIPTHDTDMLHRWLALNRERVAAFNVDVAPAASRCTVQLQDHDSTFFAYRLEF